MTRKEQIKNTASILANNTHEIDCFAAGAEWADSHPNWHIDTYPEPEDDKDEPENAYLNQDSLIAYYMINKESGRTYWIGSDYCPIEVIAWTEVLEPPKFN